MMLFTKSLTALAGCAAAFWAASMVLAPAPIEVHSLTYRDGIVIQDRTVTTDTDYFFAFWTAKIVQAESRIAVRHCQGDGSWPYSAGRIAAEIPLDEWVGSSSCTPDSLPPGTYIPVASWSWGGDSTSHEGEPFVIP